jgi:tRNA pseudouridine38-40 synthase
MIGVCLVVAYDGTDFAGYQVQPHQRTVQAELERAAAQLTGHTTRVRAAGRTDAGVHALSQIVAFDSARNIPAKGFMRGLNQLLPDDVRVQRAAVGAAGYEPRFEAMGKIYRYLVQLGEPLNPLLRTRAYHLGKSRVVDVGRIREAAAMLEGTHDFRAFRSADDARENSTRTIYGIKVIERFQDDPSLLAFDVHGTAFMKNMVRIMAGTLLDVGRGRIPLAEVPKMLGPLAQRDETGLTAPAHGLTLLHVALGRRQTSPFESGAVHPV